MIPVSSLRPHRSAFLQHYLRTKYMPVYHSTYRSLGQSYLSTNPYQGVGSSGSNAMTVPAPPTQQGSQQSVVMGHQSPAQLLMNKVRSVLTQAEIDMFQDMTAKVTALMTPDEMQEMTAITAAQLTNAVDLDDLANLRHEREDEQDALSLGAIPVEGIQPGYNCLDPDMATTIVVNWLDHGDATVQDLNDVNGRMPNGEYLTDGPNGLIHGKKPRPRIAIERLYVGDGGAMASVNAMLAGCTLQEPDCYRITDGLVEVVVTHDMIDAHRKPPVLTQQSLAVPLLGASRSYLGYSKGYGNTVTPGHFTQAPADIIAGPSYDDILNERDKRLHDERLVQEGAIELSEFGRSASKLTPKGTKMTVRFPKPRANPLTGVPDPAPRALLLQEGIKALRQVDADTADDLVQHHHIVGVQLELTEFDPALVPPGVDATALVIEQGPAPALPSAPVVPQGMTAIYTPAVDLGVIGFEDMINEAYRTLEFTWSNCHPQDSAFSCLIMKAIETAEEWVRMSPLNAPDATKGIRDVLETVHEALAVSVALPGPKAAPMSPGQLAQSIPGSTVTTGTSSSGMSITANANTTVQWQQVSAWSNQGGLQGVGQYLNVQAPLFQSPTDEDGDEIPSIRIRHLKPNHEYRSQDGTVIEVDGVGNFLIKDEAAQITYRATRMRDFNRFVNGSDLVGEFIEDLGKLKDQSGGSANVTQEQAAGAPMEMFIRWLVHKAAEHDKEEPPQDVPVVSLPAAPILITDDGVRVAELVGA